MDRKLNPLEPWILVAVYLVDLFGMWLISRHRTHGWRLRLLFILPLSIIVLYTWVVLFNPSAEQSRYVARYCLLMCGGVAMYAIYDYLKAIKTQHNRRHNDR